MTNYNPFHVHFYLKVTCNILFYDIVNYYCMKTYQVKQKVIKDDFINNLIASFIDLLRLLIET